MNVQRSRSPATSKASYAGDWRPVRSGISRSPCPNTRTEYISPQNKCFGLLRRICVCYKSKVVTVEPVVFLYMFALYLYLIVFELYVFNTYGKEAEHKANVTNMTDFCLNTGILENMTNSKTGREIQSQTAILNLIIGTVSKLPTIIACLFLGPLSDRYGRKPIFIALIIGFMLDATIGVIIISKNLSLYIFILGSVLRGVTGGVAGILSASYTYIADISSTKWLTFRLGALEATTFIAGTLSLVGGGILVQYTKCDFRAAAYTVLGCLIFALLYAVMALPESKRKQEDNELDDGQQPQEKKDKPPLELKSVLRGFRIFLSREYPRKKLWLALIAMMIGILNTTGTVVIITLYLLYKPFKWGPFLIGTYLATSELVHGIALMVFLPILIVSGISDPVIAMVGIGMGCSMDILLGFSDKTWQVFTVGIIQGMDSLILPSLKAIMSKTVDPSDQGALFSFVSALQVFTSMIAYLFYSLLYAKTIDLGWEHSAGISFFVMGGLYLISFCFVAALLGIHKHEKLQTPTALQSKAQLPQPSSPQTVGKFGEKKQRLQSQPITVLPSSPIPHYSPVPSYQSGGRSIQDDLFTSEIGKEASGSSILSERARLLRETDNAPFVTSYQSVASYYPSLK